MEREDSLKELNIVNFEQFKLPEDFAFRLQELEIALYEGTLTHNNLKELFELYSTASSHFEAQGMMDEFNFYIHKMQDLLRNEKIQPLLIRRKSQEMVTNYSLSIDKKKEKVEKIKTLLKENKKEKNSKKITNNLLQNINTEGNKAEIIIIQDLNSQEESFKKRLEERRLQRGYSLPHMKLKAKLGEAKSSTLNLPDLKGKEIPETPFEKRKSIKQSNTPPKRKSTLTQSTFGSEDLLKQLSVPSSTTQANFKKISLEMDFTAERKSIQRDSKLVNEDNFNKIFDREYEEKIETNFLKVWESAEKRVQLELDKIEEEMIIFLDNLADEKFRRTLEINEKYDNELKEMKDDINLNDENNVNTIIYNELKMDKEKELSDFYKELNERKIKGVQDLRNKSVNVKNNLDKKKEIAQIKSDISQGIKCKIIKYFVLKEKSPKKIDFNNINMHNISPIKSIKGKNDVIYRPFLLKEEDNSDNYSNSGESADEVKIDGITLNKNLRKSGDKKMKDTISKIPSQKRVSRGFVGNYLHGDR